MPLPREQYAPSSSHPSFSRWLPDSDYHHEERASSHTGNNLPHLDQLERTLTMSSPSHQQHSSESLTQRAADQSRAHHYASPAAPTLGANQYAQQAHAHQNIPPQHVGMSSAQPTHPQSSPHVSAPPSTSTTSARAAAHIPEHQLERLVNRVAHKLVNIIQDDSFLDKFLNTRELLEDNKTLASQVQQLLRDNKQLEAEVSQAQSAVSGFKRIVGNIYLKMDN